MTDVEVIDWLVRFTGALVLTVGGLWLLARLALTAIAWHRSRPAFVKDYTDAREYMAVSVMLSRRCWAIRLPGAWVTITRPLYRRSSDHEAWDQHRIFALAALSKVKQYAPNQETGA